MSTPPEERRVRPFADFLQDHNRGAMHTKAGEALQRLVTAVQDTGKKGSVTLTVTVDPMKQSENALVTTITIGEKLPTVAPKGAVFYADADGNLTRTDPAQGDLFEPLREVEPPPLRIDAAAPAAGGEEG